MSDIILVYVSVFAVAFLITLIFTPIAKKISVKLGAIDFPKARSVHKEPIPRLGGIAIVVGFLVPFVLLCLFVEQLQTQQFLGFLIGAIIIVIAGILDDIFILSAKMKLLFQSLAALCVIATGTIFQIYSFSFDAIEFTYIINVAITFFWIIGVTNAVNLIDGLDGLAAGVSAISSFCLMMLCMLSGNYMAAIITALLAGTCLGFLPRNFNPSEIIMGDTGALFLGYVLAVTSIIGVYKSYALLTIIVAMFALAVPVFDTLFSMLRRLKNGQPMLVADRGHFHHRLMDAGYSQRLSVFILYFVSIVFGFFGIVLFLGNKSAIATSVILFGIIVIIIYEYKRRQRKSE